MGKTVDFDVAHALVDYLSRDGDNDSYAWGELTTSFIKIEICELKTSKWRVDLSKLSKYLVDRETGVLIGSANSKLIRLRQLLKEVAK